MNKRILTAVILLLLTIAATAEVISHYISPLDSNLLFALRWAALGGLLVYAFRKKSLTTWILISMLVGAEVGHDFPEVAVQLQLLSQIFLKMIKTIIAPLIFGTLVVGIAGHSGLKQVGRMGLKSIIYFEVVTTIALFIGLAAINISKAGVGIQLPEGGHEELPKVVPQTFREVILHIFPENFAKSVAEGQVLQIVVFSIIFGIALAMLSPARRQPMLSFAEGLSDVMFKFTNVIMYFAPVGVGAAMAYTVGHMGLGILVNLFQLLATLYVALLVFLLFVLLPVALIVRVPLKKFISAITGPTSRWRNRASRRSSS